MSTNEDIEQMLADCEARESKLSVWEREFVDSVSKQFAERGSITQRQDEKLTAIWEKVTS